jgi:hypothetical protein
MACFASRAELQPGKMAQARHGPGPCQLDMAQFAGIVGAIPNMP